MAEESFNKWFWSNNLFSTSHPEENVEVENEESKDKKKKKKSRRKKQKYVNTKGRR